MTDPIADMITRFKNAGESQKDFVVFPFSKLKYEICVLLEKEGLIKSVAKKGKKTHTSIEVALLYGGPENLPRIQDVKRVSKPSRRVYKKASELRPVKNGYGSLILSTPKGILTDVTARKDKVGGEALFEIW
jgi:small subunit ribosomal protein S8